MADIRSKKRRKVYRFNHLQRTNSDFKKPERLIANPLVRACSGKF